jgi:amino acid transporter
MGESDPLVENKKSLGFVALVALIFLNVAGGPYGSEGIIRGSGSMGLVIACIIFPLFWAYPPLSSPPLTLLSLPAALITAELGTAFPYDGGFAVWAKEALGPFWGFVLGLNAFISRPPPPPSL